MRMQSPPLGLHRDDVPSERKIVSLWRSAASEAGRSRKPSGFGGATTAADASVTCIREPWIYASDDGNNRNADEPLVASSTATASDMAFDMSRLDSKRDMLEHIQQRCPLEFLRKHRLNSSIEVVLRKTNRTKLLAAWNDWVSSGEGSASTSSAQAKKNIQRAAEENTEKTFRAILLGRFRGSKENDGNRTNGDPTVPPPVMAAVLHESMDNELPCWNSIRDETSGPARLCLFLGAVRDMTSTENSMLTKVCSELNIPLLRCRLGPVPEFTSKILSVVTYHNAVGALGPAAWHMWKRKQSSRVLHANKETGTSIVTPHCGKRRLHVLCNTPISSVELTHDISSRSRELWCLVRLCVCTLWRSKLVSSSVSSDTSPIILENALTIVFRDGVLLTLEQEDLVKTLAEKHQAAPSEHQILVALCQKRDEASKQEKCSIKRLVKKSIKAWRKSLEVPEDSICYCIELSKKNGAVDKPSLVDRVYSDILDIQGGNTSNELIFANLSITSDKAAGLVESSYASVFGKLGVPVVKTSIIPSDNCAQDAEASAITMLQHFQYQQRLVPALRACIGSEGVLDDKKRKKHERKSKKQKSSKKRRKEELAA